MFWLTLVEVHKFARRSSNLISLNGQLHEYIIYIYGKSPSRTATVPTETSNSSVWRPKTVVADDTRLLEGTPAALIAPLLLEAGLVLLTADEAAENKAVVDTVPDCTTIA